MSKNNLLALAVAAALAAPTAFATTLTVTAPTVNSNQFVDETVAVNLANATVAATASDNYLGRTVGYNVRVKLSAGVIKTTPTIAATGGAASATLVTGTGAPGSTEFVVNVVPGSGGTQVGEGFIIGGDPDAGGTAVAVALEVEDLAALGAGGTVALSGAVYDPTTAIELPGSAFSKTVLTAKQGVAVAYTATTTPNVIDVGQPSGKKFFTGASALIGSGVSGNLFNAGVVSINNATGVDAWLPGTGTADVTVTGEDFSAFVNTATTGTNAKIFLAEDAACATAIGAAGTIAKDGKSATFTGVALNTLSVAAPFDAHVCFDANGAAQIARQDIKASAVVKPGAAFLNYTAPVGGLASMAYNGPVVNVLTFNPAKNVAQESFLRISNTSNIGGKVTVEGTCDDGTAMATPVSFNLEAGKSVLLTAGEIENGSTIKGLSNGLGACSAGKSRLVVTGEFSTMQVQNFIRNVNSAGTTTTNVNNAD
jgi:hypothetical protein